MENALKLVQVGSQVFLGFLEGSGLSKAVRIEGDLGHSLQKGACARYLSTKELGKLTSMQIGSVDTVSSRELTEEELHLLEEVNYIFDRARKTALSSLIVREFNDLLGK